MSPVPLGLTQRTDRGYLWSLRGKVVRQDEGEIGWRVTLSGSFCHRLLEIGANEVLFRSVFMEPSLFSTFANRRGRQEA